MGKLDNYECDGQMDMLNYMSENFQPIEICIGIGSRNATKRNELPALLNEKDDRMARRRLNQYRKLGYVIVNDGRGKGYYRPLPEDYQKVLAHYKKEKSKADDILEALEAEKKWLCNMDSRGVVE